MQTDRVLSCPPDACMFFNCPGHESRFKGVFGCRIDAVSAAVDTPFALEFAVPDSQTPPNIATVQRLIVVVSPCGAEEIYCADLADPQQPPGSGHACGTTDCDSRAVPDYRCSCEHRARSGSSASAARRRVGAA